MRRILLLLTASILCSCGEVKRLDTSKIKDQMGNYKVKQIRPDEMMTKVRSIGENTQKVIQAAQNCDQLSYTIDSLTQVLQASISLVDVSSISIDSIQDKKEQMLYDAYQFAAKENETLPTNAQKLENGQFIYSFGSSSLANSCEPNSDSSQYFWELRWTQEALLQSF